MKQRFACLLCVLVSTALPAFAEQKETAPAAGAPAAAPQAGTAPGAKAPEADTAVARVNGREIKRQELNAAMQGLMMDMASRGQSLTPDQSARFEKDVLDELIGRELILEEGRKEKVADLDTKVAAEMTQLQAKLGGEDKLTTALKEAGLTRDGYAARVRDNLIVQAAMQRITETHTNVTPEEVKSFYDKNPEKFKQPETVRASHILIRLPPGASEEEKAGKRAQIEVVRTRLQQGEKFADVARKMSEDPGSAANGGDLGYFPQGAMVPAFDTAAFSLKTNELSQVITTPFGYHILLVTDRKPAHQLAFDEVKTRLEQGLKNQKGMEAARKHVADLRTTSKVEILLPASTPAQVPATK